jgi:hypothetical protein
VRPLTDGWNAFGPASWDSLANQSKILRDAAAQAGKPTQACEVVLRTSVSLSDHPRAEGAELFTGTLEQIKGRHAAGRFIGSGADYLRRSVQRRHEYRDHAQTSRVVA